MVKKTLVTLALLAALVPFVSRTAAAQSSAQRPVPAVGWNILAPAHPPVMLDHPKHVDTIPPYCSPGCLFYGGDIDTTKSNADGFANGNTVNVPLTTTFSPFTVPVGQKWAVTALFGNNVGDTGVLDPAQASWTIAIDMNNGSPGTIIASGTTTATAVPTGRVAFGRTEYTVKTALGTTVHLGPGNYWESVVPQCTNSGDSGCTAQWFLDNTFGLNAVGPAEPQFHGFFNSAFFGFTYTPLCEVSTLGCNASSAGVIGRGE
ncbi:MAG TPA: hypothetical protein VGW33_01630 [Terriglobia bacterium]|nr:hypothetical protein [Terriglobia bacterium]